MTTPSRIPATALAQRPGQRLLDHVLSAGHRAVCTLLRWQELSRQRRALEELDDRLLKDIGLTRADVLQEATRPFWDDPRR
jgi:uncharacterized protein YjiS (DUF1127 family)